MKLPLIIILATVKLNISAHIIRTKSTHPGEERWMHPEFANERIINLKKPAELSSEYWVTAARNVVTENSQRKLNKNVAKNLILFMGDGLSTSTITATRSYINDDSTRLSFERFPYTGQSLTYCIDVQVPDSACTATAYLSGVKGNFRTIGLNGRGKKDDCNAQNIPEKRAPSIAQWAIDGGKSAGLITTARVTHASPAGVYAHTGHRDWEADSPCNQNVTEDIARQLIRGSVGSKLKVILGGGRAELLDITEIDEEGHNGKRKDKLNLIKEWKQRKGDRSAYVWNRTELLNVNPDETEYLLGLFESDHCKYNLQVLEEGSQEMEPTLTEMTEKAIDVLSKERNGYFLFIEGGKIDQAHHDNYARLALDETAEFSKAIGAALRRVNLEETLIVVTADHSHAFSFSGYPHRDSDVLSTSGNAADGMDFYTLSYANGFGYFDHVKTSGRVNPADLEEDRSYNIKHRYPGMTPLSKETHGGDDVSVYAIGPWSHLFSGSYEQHVIPHMMAYAACIGNGLKACEKI